MKAIVHHIIANLLRNSPKSSYQRLNPALRDTLGNCIAAGLPFQPDTFARIYRDCDGSFWFGDGAGSHVGENFYTLACEMNHTTACQSFERWAKRPAVLWEEDVQTPTRLHVGARFTWQGHYLTVTSLRTDRLVACTYKDTPAIPRGLKVGATIGDYNHPHVVTAAKKVGARWQLSAIPARPDHDSRCVDRRFTIAYADIAEFRRTENQRVKALLERIEDSAAELDRTALAAEISAAHFRHFQLERINAAWQRRMKARPRAESVAAWRSGANGAWLETDAILLRIKDGSVECSNGNRVSLAAARRTLPILLARRRITGDCELPLDGHTIERTGSNGVQIGCTLVPWSEIERLKPLLTSDH